MVIKELVGWLFGWESRQRCWGLLGKRFIVYASIVVANMESCSVWGSGGGGGGGMVVGWLIRQGESERRKENVKGEKMNIEMWKDCVEVRGDEKERQ